MAGLLQAPWANAKLARTDVEPRMSEETTKSAPTDLRRRALLRGASAALPTVLTLQSGAALAQSSNLMGTVQSASQAVGEGGRVQCLDAASVDGGTTTVLDLGETPTLHVQYVTPRSYFLGNQNNTAGDSSKPVSIQQMCSRGGRYWYFDRGWKQISVGYNQRGIEAGFLVSATALASFASAVKVKSVF